MIKEKEKKPGLIQEKMQLATQASKAWDRYQASLSDASCPHWDYVVITASNQNQAKGFEAQLSVRRSAGVLPSGTDFFVVPDPVGERVGNGGAMLGAMRCIAEHSGKSDFSGLRALVILSSGDSKRVPQYSALGKVFSPVPRILPDGRASTLFDEILIFMSGIPSRMAEGMLVLSGDVMLVFDSDQIDYSPDSSLALAFSEPVEMGNHHGVFLSNSSGQIAKVWHKRPADFLRLNGAVDSDGQVSIDTGAVIFASSMVNSLFKLICDESGCCTDTSFHNYVNGHLALSMYVDFFYPLAVDSTFEGYLAEIPEGKMSPELLSARTILWKLLRPHRIKLASFSPARFIHFGTTLEVYELMSSGISSYSYLGWQRQICSSVSNPNIACYESTISPDLRGGSNVYIEKSIVCPGCTIGSNTILSFVSIENQDIPSNVVLNCLHQDNGTYVCRIYGLKDDPKATLERGATLFGVPLSLIMSRNGLSESDLWDAGEEHSLWNARLYPECITMREAVNEGLNLHRIAFADGSPSELMDMTRQSMKASFGKAVAVFESEQ